MGEGGRYRALGEFLSQFPRVVKTGDGWNVSCPTGAHTHGDRKPSLHVSEHEDKILLHCHTGCATDTILAALKLDPIDLFLSRNGGKSPAPTPNPTPKIVAIYDYTDAAGALLYQTVRYMPKDFRQRRPSPDRKGGWVWDLKGVETVLYRLPALLAAIAAHETVYVVEGEKDADTLTARGLCATTAPLGAGKWRRAYSDSLRGAEVAIIPDSDPPGLAHGEAIRASLMGVAASVRLLRIPTGHGKDITDYLGAGGDMAALVDTTPPPTPTRPDGILAMMGADEGAAGASDPVVAEEIDGLSLTWGREHIRADITRLYQHHNGNVACEVFLTYCLPGDPPRYLLRHSIDNLANARTREGLAKLLSKHTGPDWPGMVHQICEYSLAQMRRVPQGNTATDFEQFGPPSWILHPFLVRHENNLLFAPGGGGKSYLALYWTVLLESAHPHPFESWIVRDEPFRVLMLDWERSWQTNAYRFGQILLGLSLPIACPDAPLNYQRMAQPLRDETRNVQALINRFGCNVLIVDSALGAAGGDLLKPEPASDYFRALNSLHAADSGPLTTLTLAHLAKNNDTGRKSAYGAAAWTNEPSSVWELVPTENAEHNVTQFSLQDNKRNHGWNPPQYVQVDYRSGDQGTIYAPCNPPQLPQPGAGHESRILDALTGQMSPSEIARSTGVLDNIVSTILARLALAGLVRRVSRGVWEKVETVKPTS